MAHLLTMTGIYVLYAGRLRRQVLAGRLPGHVGLIMDGNRRWARQAGMANPSLGHRAGAEHAEQVLSWCEAVGIKNVTVFICSTENLRHRDDAEVAYLMQVIEDVVTARLAARSTVAGTRRGHSRRPSRLDRTRPQERRRGDARLQHRGARHAGHRLRRAAGDYRRGAGSAD